MPRIYTRTGDGGDTSFFDGKRTSKADPRVDLYGGVDELNSWLGFCAAQVPEQSREVAGSLLDALSDQQHDLLEMGSILADPERSRGLSDGEGVLPLDSRSLEKRIDALNRDLPELRHFILPGGHPAAAALHIARTVCRRVERRAVGLRSSEPIPDAVIAYLNRLSDYLFVAARWANHVLGHKDIIWRTDRDSREESPS